VVVLGRPILREALEDLHWEIAHQVMVFQHRVSLERVDS